MCSTIVSSHNGCCWSEVYYSKEKAENSTKCSLTADIWASFANDAYISVTVHFIDDCWKMKSYTMAMYSFPEQYTATTL